MTGEGLFTRVCTHVGPEVVLVLGDVGAVVAEVRFFRQWEWSHHLAASGQASSCPAQTIAPRHHLWAMSTFIQLYDRSYG